MVLAGNCSDCSARTRPRRSKAAASASPDQPVRLLPFACISLALIARSTLAHPQAHTPPLLPEKQVAALANELSGETAKRNLEGLARFHRQRGSQGFHAAAELVAERARAYGLSNVQIQQFPADG